MTDEDTQGYALDRYVTAIIEKVSKDLVKQKEQLPQPLAELWLYMAQNPPIPESFVVRGEDGTEEMVGLPDLEGALEALELGGDEDLLDQHAAEFDLDEPLGWGDYLELPTSLLYRDFVLAAKEIAARVQKAGVKLAPGWKAGLLIEDESFDSEESFAENARESLAELPKPAAKALLALCYADPKSAAWTKAP
jgi:hypothetical protein